MAKYRGKGVSLQLGDGATPTEAFTAIPQLHDFGGPTGGDREETDATTHDSPGDAREFLAGFVGAQEVTWAVAYDPDEVLHGATTGLPALRDSGEVRNWKLVFEQVTGSPELAFAGFVKSVQIEPPIDGLLRMTGSIRVSGQITFPG